MKYLRGFVIIFSLIAVYIGIYLTTIFFKLNYAMTNDGFNKIFSLLYLPMMEVHGRINKGPISGFADYRGSNFYKDKIFFSQNKVEYGGYVSSGVIVDDSIKENDRVIIEIEYGHVDSNNSFHVYKPWKIKSIRKSPQ